LKGHRKTRCEMAWGGKTAGKRKTTYTVCMTKIRKEKGGQPSGPDKKKKKVCGKEKGKWKAQGHGDLRCCTIGEPTKKNPVGTTTGEILKGKGTKKGSIHVVKAS